MTVKLQLPKMIDLKPRLTVIGVGGAGCNAVNNMIAGGLQGVDFVVANTDAQCLAAASTEHRLQLGASLTEGLGAGSRPEIGEAAAQEAIEEIKTCVAGSHMLFIAAGMGGGTGTGAASVIARAARELGVLTVAIVCKPFQFEGARRMRIADAGIANLREHVDTLIIIPNQNLFRIANERTTFAEAFVMADQVLFAGVACIVELVLKEGLINLDFADVKTVMSGMGTAMMGTGEASGERRARLAAEDAITNPLLDDVSLKGAKGLLLSISGGRDLTLYEVDEAASRVREEVDPDCNIIVGATFDENLGERVRVSIVASGMGRLGEAAPARKSFIPAQPAPPPGLAPRYQPAPTSQQRPEDAAAVHRRLAEALQGAQAIAQMPDEMHDQIRFTRDAVQQSASGESWNGPGNVTIQEGFAGAPAAIADQKQKSVQSYTVEPHATFQPAAPTAIPRGANRVPSIDEFPAVGQKAWRAGQPGAEQSVGGEHQKKGGFFGRITGRGKRPADDSTSSASVDSSSKSGSKTASYGNRERR